MKSESSEPYREDRYFCQRKKALLTTLLQLIASLRRGDIRYLMLRQIHRSSRNHLRRFVRKPKVLISRKCQTYTAPTSINLRAYHTISPLFCPVPSTLWQCDSPITNEGIHTVITRAETPQLHFLPVLDLFRVTVSPLHGHL